MTSRPATALLLVLGVMFATAVAADSAVMRWQFSYKGPRVTARGVLETAAEPEADGSYRILSIAGKRNGKRIVELLPEGEMLTSEEQFMFADNRLLPASPYMTEAGFSYRTSDSKYFNVCHAWEEGYCGRDGYREFDGRKGGRSVEFELVRVADETPAATPVATPATPAATPATPAATPATPEATPAATPATPTAAAEPRIIDPG
jgi:hypothetical protein